MSINDGQWHHVCFTWTSSTGQWQAYKDGSAASGKTGANPVTINAITGNKKLISNGLYSFESSVCSDTSSIKIS